MKEDKHVDDLMKSRDTLTRRLKEVNSTRDALFFSFDEAVGLLLVISMAILVRVGCLFTIPFLSDEAIYSYKAYAIGNGLIPYQQVHLVHPPLLYIIYSFPIRLFGVNLITVRLFSVAIFLVIILLTYALAKLLFSREKEIKTIALLCIAIYALYPPLIPFTISSPLVNLFTVFTLAGLVFYALFPSWNRISLVLTGVFMGLSLMTWYIALPMIVSLLIYHTVTCIRQRNYYKKVMMEIASICLGIFVPTMLTLLWIALTWHSFSLFQIQTFSLHVSLRSPMTSAEKWISITAYIEYFSPLLMVGLFGALISLFVTKKSNLTSLPIWFYTFNFLFISLLFRTILFHYFLPLTPYIIILIMYIFHFVRSSSFRLKRLKNVDVRLITALLLLLLSIATVLINMNTMVSLLPYFRFGYSNPYTEVELYIGFYIKNLTTPNNKIWSSEPAIAFFAQRIIVAPNSSTWPLQGFFNDVFSTSYVNMYGVSHEGLGLVEPYQFIEAWESEDVRVLVFILRKGPVPYPDEILWEGYSVERGVKGWVEQHFELKEIVTNSEVAYSYYVWLKR